MQQITKSYHQPGAEIKVLLGVNLEVAKGETVAIVGQSGSGKSTLLALLAGLDAPTSGTICLAGKDLSKMSEHQLAKFRAANLGIIFQQFHLISNLSALENIALPLEINNNPEAFSRAKIALEKVGLAHRSRHLPSALSGGERQRVAIARAFVVEPAILLADEPSGNLDTKTGTQVMDLLFDNVAQQHSTMILVTHNLKLAARCQTAYELSGGILVKLNPNDLV